MKKFILIAIFALILTGCAKKSSYEKYQTEFYDCFDTIIDVTVYAKDEKEGNRQLTLIREEFQRLHKLFDRYNDYEGVVNFKTVNDAAGKSKVKVPEEVFNLMKFSIDMNEKVSKKVNVAIGPVVDVWTKYRDLYLDGKSKEEVKKLLGSALPTKEELEKLRPLISMDDIELDEKEHIIFLKKEGMKLEMGSVAKGYATELVAQYAKKNGVTSAVISAGGNVRIIGKPTTKGKEAFLVGIRNPDADEGSKEAVKEILKLNETSVVTSGDYQRYFDLDGKRYCHIIDPDTLYPGSEFKSVTINNLDSGLCDFLSTACFLSSETEARNMLKKENAEGYFIDKDGKVTYTEGFSKLIKK